MSTAHTSKNYLCWAFGLCSVSAFKPVQKPSSQYIAANITLNYKNTNLHIGTPNLLQYENEDIHCPESVEIGIYDADFEPFIVIKADELTSQKGNQRFTFQGHQDKVAIYFSTDKIGNWLKSQHKDTSPSTNKSTTHAQQ